MVAGLRGSSSGMPASTLPTRSPPTSAPLVKMPPPRRAKIEISEAPKPSATSASMTARLAGSSPSDAGQEDEVDRDTPSSARPATSRPVTAPDLKATSRPPPSDWRRRLGGADVGAHRDVHADEAGRARKHRADGEADARPGSPRRQAIDDEQDDADDGDRRVLAAQIGLRAFADRAGDLLHALRAGVALHDVVDGPQSIGDRAQAAQDDEDECGHCTVLVVVDEGP